MIRRALLQAAWQRGRESAARVLKDARLRGETSWVVTHWVAEFLLMFGLLKLLTNLMGKEGYGEYQLALSALLVLAYITVQPVMQAYLRSYHSAESDGEGRAAGFTMMRWYCVVTCIVPVAAVLLTGVFADWFGLREWTVLAAGLAFVGFNWRYLGIDVLTIQRRRRDVALQTVGFLVLQMGLIVVLVRAWGATPFAALIAYAISAPLISLLAVVPYIRQLLAQPAGAKSRLMPLVYSFGFPGAMLMTCQWVQMFADRYILKALLDFEAVGAYVAAFQVCSAPYFLLFSIFMTLLRPIVYQRSRNMQDPGQLWSADKVLLGGAAVYLLLGGLALLLYAVCGPWLIVLLTNAQFKLPWATVLMLALSRFAVFLGMLLELFFAIHGKMTWSLGFRVTGALVTIPVCWWSIGRWGLPGAAAGALLVAGGYAVLVFFAPYGCFWLMRSARRGAIRAAQAAPAGEPAADSGE